MTPAHRDWATRFVAQLRERLDLYARIGLGREGQGVLVASLQHVVDRYDALLATPIAAKSVTPIATATPALAASPCGRDATAWSNPIFWTSGCLDPFAGTRADRMRASAATCRQLGYHDAARAFDRHADDAATAVPAAVLIDEVAQVHLAAIAPFVAGPQLALFA